MPIQVINDLIQFQTVLQTAERRLVVVDFYADWCGPCRMIAPAFENLSNEFTDVIFIKVNVDHARSIAGTYQITAMPTFIFFRDGNEVERLRGADPNRIRQLIQQFSSQIGSSSTSANNRKAANSSEKAFLQRFVHYADRMQIYEDEIAQTLALSLVPLEELKSKATIDEKLSHYLLAKELMAWFKNSFFKWTDKPICPSCNIKTEGAGKQGNPTAEEREDDAQRVEVYECLQCKSQVRFPRYNNPIKLLETRNGRCGEWANCFALFCRSVGLETRYIMDNLDHVWVEIWAEELQRWIHCDPCENVMDTPLMYENGWNKKYSYVIAFAKDHVIDVTWRYTFDRKLTTKRRTQCRPAVFYNFITKLSNRLSKNLPQERQKEFKRRYMREMIEFLWPENNKRDGSEAENHGRISGSKQWREARGETSQSSSSSYVIKPTANEIEAKCLEVTYNSAIDEYRRPHDASTSKGFKSLAFECKNVFRKVEADWKKAYLCRTEGSEKGEIVWKIEFIGEKPKSITINCGESFCRDDGNVLGVVCCGEQCVRVNDTITINDFNDEATYLEFRVEFTGGKGPNAWQHAQLLRCDLENVKPNFSIRVEFE
jgi:peptide-N4-(N-acetyl-beta-glucosaminyl)asparagine amidase